MKYLIFVPQGLVLVYMTVIMVAVVRCVYIVSTDKELSFHLLPDICPHFSKKLQILEWNGFARLNQFIAGNSASSRLSSPTKRDSLLWTGDM